MPRSLTVAAVQLTSTSDVSANLQEAHAWSSRAADAGADLVCLPENFGFFGGDERQKLVHAQPVDGPFTAPLRQLAKQRGIFVLAGSIPERGPDEEHVYNTSVLIGPDGGTVAAYRKIHLFDIDFGARASWHESAHVTPGEGGVLASVRDFVVGLSVCYDLRFPELYRRYSAAGARLLTVPSAFTLHTGKDHWEVLLRARAIENQCYVVAPGQFGEGAPGKVSWGKSMVIDPWGTLLAVAPERPGFALAVCDPDAQDAVRAKLPALQHRRL